MAEKFQWVEVFEGPSHEANFIRGVLESHGLEVFLDNQHFASLYPQGIPGSVFGVRVFVHHQDLSSAEQLLKT